MANYTYRNVTSRSTRLGYRTWTGLNRQLDTTGRISDPLAACGECGQLECLCRPRFFAGQLLTEEDLNRLDQYIVKKQRLHNRHLHGWGVVCGLELRCDPCANNLIVTSGYGLSPCGDDIVVCHDDVVDICQLIQSCLERERKAQPCDPPHYGNNGCKDETEDWLLMIRYQETPSRGITALRNATAEARCRSCDCGSSGGCDCNGAQADTGQITQSRVKPQPAQCEPTVVCEDYSYEVCRVPAGYEKDPLPSGAMQHRFAECSQPFIDYFTGYIDDLVRYYEMTMDELYALCCSMKGTMLDLLAGHASHNCTLSERLHRLICPEPDPDLYDIETYRNAITERLQVIRVVWFYGLLDCICSVLLPVCETSDDPRLVLGRVTVNKSDCKVLRVCNWIVERKFATTFPNLQYWLSWLPYMRMLRQMLEQGCCDFSAWLEKGFGHIGSLEGMADFKAFDTLGMASMAGAKKYAKDSQTFSNLAFSLFAGGSNKLTPKTLFNGVMGLTDEEGKPYMSDEERENLLPLLMMDSFGANLFSGGMPSGLSAVAGLAAGFTAEPTADIGDLKAELSALKETVELQKRQIDELNKRVG